MLFKPLFSMLMTGCVLGLGSAYANDLIPINDDDFYYTMGGGRSYGLPATHDKNSAPLGFEGELGLGYSCGVFNPLTAIRNTLNKLKE